jgi:predicted lipoprotein
MSNSTIARTRSAQGRSSRVQPKKLIIPVALLVLLVLMVANTKFFFGDQASQAAPGTFSPVSFAQEKYESEIAPDIEDRATDVVTVANAIKADSAAAAKEYGVVSGTSAAVYSVKFTGTAAKPDANGLMQVAVPDLPADTKVFVQTGPAVNGTAIRDATGKVDFSQFKNQIDYQNVGSELNNQVKERVLSNLDKATIEGKQVEVVGAFQLVSPTSFVVTPVKMDVR